MPTEDNLNDTTFSDYDAEWGRADAPGEDQGVDAESQYRQSDDDDTASDSSAPADTDGEPGEDPKASSAESEDNGNPPGDEPNDQQEAMRTAEIEINSLRGQNKALNDRLASRGRELKELRQELAELKEQTRQPTKFEQEFPEYAEDIRKITGGGKEEELEPESDRADAEAETVEKILAAHPDAGTLYNTPDLHEYLKSDPVFTFNGQPMFVNAAIHSDNADEVIAGLAFYKEQTAKQAPAKDDTPPQKDPLADMDEPPRSGGAPSMPKPARSVQEQYEAAWDNDDL